MNIVLDNWGAGCNPLPQPPQGGYVAIPYVPTGLAATPGASEVSLVWTASQSAASYSVLRSTTSGSGFVSIASGLTDDELRGHDRHQRHDLLLRGYGNGFPGNQRRVCAGLGNARSRASANALRESCHLDEWPNGLLQHDGRRVWPDRRHDRRLGLLELHWPHDQGGQHHGDLRAHAAAGRVVGWIPLLLHQRREILLRQPELVVIRARAGVRARSTA